MFPSMDAFGGWGAVLGHRVGEYPVALKLSELNKGYHRFPDTYRSDYANYLRDAVTGADLGPLTKVNRGPFDDYERVALVGAGIGNLIAAYELARCDVLPIVFEAEDKVGGRLRSVPLGEDTPSCELGAMRFPEKSKLFWHYYSKYWPPRIRIPIKDPVLEPFPNPGVVPTHINWQNQIYQWSQHPVLEGDSNLPAVMSEVRREFKVRWEQFGIDNPPNPQPITIVDVKRILAKATLSDADHQQVVTFWKGCIAKYEHRSVGSVLADPWTNKDDGKTYQWDVNQLNAFATLGMGTGGFGPLFSVSFLEMLRLMIWDYAAEYELPADTSCFAEWMAEQVRKEVKRAFPREPDPIHLNSKVEKVEVLVDEAHDPMLWVRVITNKQSWNFGYAIVGMPTRAMQVLGLDTNAGPSEADGKAPYQPYALPQTPLHGPMDFSPIIESVQAAIKRPNTMSASKTFTRVKKDELYGSLWPYFQRNDKVRTKLPIRATLTDKYPKGAYWLSSKEKAYGGMLVSYTWGNDSTKMEGVVDDQKERNQARNRLLAESFATMVSKGSMSDEYANVSRLLKDATSTVTIDWQEEPGIQGAFKLDYPGDFYHTCSLAFHYIVAGLSATPVVPAQMVYMTGCGVSFLGGWVEGAMMSALNAATAILNFRPRDTPLRSGHLLTHPSFHAYQHIGPDSASEGAAAGAQQEGAQAPAAA